MAARDFDNLTEITTYDDTTMLPVVTGETGSREVKKIAASAIAGSGGGSSTPDDTAVTEVPYTAFIRLLSSGNVPQKITADNLLSNYSMSGIYSTVTAISNNLLQSEDSGLSIVDGSSGYALYHKANFRLGHVFLFFPKLQVKSSSSNASLIFTLRVNRGGGYIRTRYSPSSNTDFYPAVPLHFSKLVGANTDFSSYPPFEFYAYVYAPRSGGTNLQFAYTYRADTSASNYTISRRNIRITSSGGTVTFENLAIAIPPYMLA